MTITALRRTSVDRITVALEDGGEIKSSLGVVTDWRLFSGKTLDEEELALLRRDSSSNTTVQKHQFFGAQLSSQSNSHIHTNTYS